MNKKIREAMFLIAAVFLMGTLCGCGMIETAAVKAGITENPYYHQGDTWWDHGEIEEYYYNQLPSELNEIYRELYSRLKNQEDSAELYATVKTQDFWTAYYAVLADHPELFWIGNSAQVKESSISGAAVEYEISVTVDKAGRKFLQDKIEEAADKCIAQIDPSASDYEKIKFVYEYLISTTDYDGSSPDNQNVQSALLNHKSVCAGYSKAFQYILHRMGMFCTYVTGSIRDGGDHGWNIVRIDGNYYHVDVTWGDPVFVNLQEGSDSGTLMNYNYLCCTDQELYRTHVPNASVKLPACTDDSYNYYKRNNCYYEYFDYDTIYQALMNSVWNGQSSVVMKFGSAESYETAKYELFDNGLLSDAGQYLMKLHGVNTWNYRYHTDDEFHLITIYWE